MGAEGSPASSPGRGGEEQSHFIALSLYRFIRTAIAPSDKFAATSIGDVLQRMNRLKERVPIRTGKGH
jgi:hypothetical protein